MYYITEGRRRFDCRNDFRYISMWVLDYDDAVDNIIYFLNRKPPIGYMASYYISQK